MRTPTATSTRATSDGFTLIELTLVVLIVGILLSIVAPRLSILGGERLDAAARRIAVLISYLHDEAALRGRIYKLSFDLDTGSYRVEVQAPFAARAAPAGAGLDQDARSGDTAPEFAVRWDPYARSGTLPQGVTLESIATADAVRTSGTTEIYFLPEDALENVTIRLAGQSGRVLELGVDGITGRVDISETDRRS